MSLHVKDLQQTRLSEDLKFIKRFNFIYEVLFKRIKRFYEKRFGKMFCRWSYRTILGLVSHLKVHHCSAFGQTTGEKSFRKLKCLKTLFGVIRLNKFVHLADWN